MSKRFSLKQLKSPDAFFKSMLAFLIYLKNNVKALLSIAGVIILITVIVVLYNYIDGRKQEKARVAFYEVTKQMQSLDENDIKSAIALLESKLDEFGKTDAGAEATYLLAELYYGEKDWENAIKFYQKALAITKKKLMKDLITLGLAYSMENKGDNQGANNAFQSLLDNATVYPEVAELGFARTSAKLGEIEKAKMSYESVIMKYPDTEYARYANTAKGAL